MYIFNPQDYGPLAPLAGVWEGSKGDDVALSNNRGIENNKYRERLVLEPIGPVDNHEQKLFALRYSTMAWRIGEPDPFHEENGYWLWDASHRQVLRCFIVPRGISVIAGGTVNPGDKEFFLTSEVGSPTYGICSNQFLDQEFKTVKFELKIKIFDANSFFYDEVTHILLKGRDKIFLHTDKNTLNRVS